MEPVTPKHQPTDVDPQPTGERCGCLMLGCPKCNLDGFEPVVTPTPAVPTPVAPPSRSRDKDRAKLAEATDRIVALERELSEANARIEALESNVAARQIRETDQAARLLNSERKLREYENIIARRADERKRGQ